MVKNFMADSKLTSRVPYLFRAMYDWIVDNGQTPYIVVDAGASGVVIPEDHVVDNRIVLNASQQAVEDFNMSNLAVSFTARFQGVSERVYLPCRSILGVYAKESGEGMLFAKDGDTDTVENTSDDDPPAGPGNNRPTLRVVK